VILAFLARVFDAIGLALSLSPELVALAAAPGTRPVALAVAVLGGASLLAGESVILFLNQVPRGRFLLSLLVNGILFAATLWVWSVTIWWIGTWAMRVPVSMEVMGNVVALGAAPFVFGFLVLGPYIGPAIARLLWVWSLLITVRAVAGAFEGGVLAAGAAVGAGWLLVLLLGHTVGRPFVHLRNRIWDRVVGPRPWQRAQDILEVAIEAVEGPTLLDRIRVRIGPSAGVPGGSSTPRGPRSGAGSGGSGGDARAPRPPGEEDRP
jgi:hypothetical protein